MEQTKLQRVEEYIKDYKAMKSETGKLLVKIDMQSLKAEIESEVIGCGIIVGYRVGTTFYCGKELYHYRTDWCPKCQAKQQTLKLLNNILSNNIRVSSERNPLKV